MLYMHLPAGLHIRPRCHRTCLRQRISSGPALRLDSGRHRLCKRLYAESSCLRSDFQIYITCGQITRCCSDSSRSSKANQERLRYSVQHLNFSQWALRKLPVCLSVSVCDSNEVPHLLTPAVQHSTQMHDS